MAKTLGRSIESRLAVTISELRFDQEDLRFLENLCPRTYAVESGLRGIPKIVRSSKVVISIRMV